MEDTAYPSFILLLEQLKHFSARASSMKTPKIAISLEDTLLRMTGFTIDHVGAFVQ
jgi:hypothetical protein